MTDKTTQRLSRRSALGTIGSVGALGIAGCMGGNGDVTTWRMETSTEATAIYQMTQGMATVINENSDRVELDARPTEGVQSALTKMDNGEIDIAYTSNLFGHRVHERMGNFADYSSDLQYLWRAYDVNLIMTAPADSGIESVGDLEGTDLSTGPTGSNPDEVLPLHLQHAVDIDTINFVPMGFGQLDAGLGEGRIDAAHDLRLSARYSSAWEQQFITNDNIRLLPWPEDAVESMNEDPEISGRMFSPESLADEYNHDPEEVNRHGEWGDHEELYWAESVFHFVTTERIDDDLMEHFMDVLWDNMDELIQYHDLMEIWADAEFISGRFDVTDIPVHPAAQRFYEGIGVDV